MNKLAPFTFAALLLASLTMLAAGAAEQKAMPKEDVVDVPAIGQGLCVANAFQSNMVLQRDKPVPIWGMAEAGEEVGGARHRTHPGGHRPGGRGGVQDRQGDLHRDLHGLRAGRRLDGAGGALHGCALQAALAPADQLPGKGTAAWKAAMQARMARNCAMIETGQGSADSESQRQYRIAQAASG